MDLVALGLICKRKMGIRCVNFYRIFAHMKGFMSTALSIFTQEVCIENEHFSNGSCSMETITFDYGSEDCWSLFPIIRSPDALTP